MNFPENKFKRGLASGATQYGLWLGLPDNSVAEIAAGVGFDWLLIDHEHGPYELPNVLANLQAIAAYDVAPIVRPVDDNPALLKRLLDMGAQSFLIPMVETAEQAVAIVAALRYPPAGKRGLGTSMARAARWNGVPDYLARANAELCLIVQVETASALANLDAILAVDGVDGVFIGPSDLSASMGHLVCCASIRRSWRSTARAGRILSASGWTRSCWQTDCASWRHVIDRRIPPATTRRRPPATKGGHRLPEAVSKTSSVALGVIFETASGTWQRSAGLFRSAASPSRHTAPPDRGT